MSIVIKSEQEKKPLVPHLAVTHNELQGGASNGRNVSLLLKADALDEETKIILKKLLGEEVTQEELKKASYENIRTKLKESIKKFSKDRWDWSYVEDFDENVVVFSNSDGVYYTSYSIDTNGAISLGDEATSVNRVISFEESSGNIVLSESDTISNNVKSLIIKSFDSISSNEKIKDIFKSKHIEGKKVMDELQKSVDLLKSQLADVQAELVKANEEKDAAKNALAAIEKAQKEAKEATRLEKLKEVVTEEEVETLQKSLASLDDESFEVVIKSLKSSKEVLENTDLFKQKSKQGDESEKDSRAEFQEMLKSKYKDQQ